VPVAGLPPVAVQVNVTGAVPPVDVALHETAVPTLPVDGQLMVTVKAAATVRVNVVVLMTPPVDVPVMVIGKVPVGVVELVVIVIVDEKVGLPDGGLKATVVPEG